MTYTFLPLPVAEEETGFENKESAAAGFAGKG
jgi:hypothetical protein